MESQPAKVLARRDVLRLLAAARRCRYPKRNRVMVLLSIKAGLRACEIARLDWRMMLGADGKIGDVIELPPKAAKMGSGRRIPIHPLLKVALAQLYGASGPRDGPVIRSERGTAMSAKVVVNWFKLRYRMLGLDGCSSHSGRRTFVTNAARAVHRAGGSLRDVQVLAGHRSIKTTQGYIEGSTSAQRKLVSLI